MHRSRHAQEAADRFRELVENKEDTLPDNHYEELALLIKAAIDTALVEQSGGTATKLNGLTHELRNNAEFFD